MRALAFVLALAACSDDAVDPITKIVSPRVLAITTEPSALPVDGEIELFVRAVDGDGPRLGDQLRMRACAPWLFVADPARDCAGENALSIEPDANGRFVTSTAALSAAFPSPPGVPAPPDPWRAALAAGIDLRVPIIVEIDVDGETLVARRDLHVIETTTVRQNPQLTEIRFDGIATETLRSGQKYVLTVAVDPASLDEVPPPEPAGTVETVDCYFYSPAGELAEHEVDIDEPAALPETAPNAYTAGPPGTTWLYVVATDETGGTSVASIPLTIE